jgi:hypothetical protein
MSPQTWFAECGSLFMLASDAHDWPVHRTPFYDAPVDNATSLAVLSVGGRVSPYDRFDHHRLVHYKRQNPAIIS